MTPQVFPARFESPSGQRVQANANGSIRRIDAGRGTTIEQVGGDADLFLDAQSRRQPFVTILIARTRSASLRITGHLISAASVSGPAAAPAAEWASDQRKTDRFWQGMVGPLMLHAPSGDSAADAGRIQEMLPWLAHNAGFLTIPAALPVAQRSPQ